MLATAAVSPEVTEHLTQNSPAVVLAQMLRTAPPGGMITAIPRRFGARTFSPYSKAGEIVTSPVALLATAEDVQARTEQQFTPAQAPMSRPRN
ncbi:hypothetical protein SK571_30655 [Lentzea sp. BCCO 10_0798]|uniref:Uncharacterized protein n=1 Tax=Lentzea kristufekii TaxID=3095430 RepID=A0ABU4TZK7_9PSEU|nr:hypothetical protein [Lentzea sp. BCCO 10_0798]MDX8053751.1 hypothetical protein [Lentzea sp. BCCO 10_0798]